MVVIKSVEPRPGETHVAFRSKAPKIEEETMQGFNYDETTYKTALPLSPESADRSRTDSLFSR